jgi:hypothetical protein
MQKIKFSLARNKTWILVLISVILLGLITLGDSFQLAMAGDDWLLHYTIWSIFTVQKGLSYFNPTSYLCTYCPHYFFLSIIEHFWGYNNFAYYFTSFIFRIGVALSLYLLLKTITRKTLPSFLASIFFTVTYLGIQTTDWVFNFNHYGGIIFVSFFLIFYWKTHEKKNILFVLYSTLTFAGALIISPPRMHGLLPLALAAELGWLLIEGKKYNFKWAGIRLLSLLLAYKVVFSGSGYGTADYNLEQVRKGIEMGLEMLAKGNWAFLLNIITTLGNYIIPDTIWLMIPLGNMPTLLPLTILYLLLSIGIFYLVKTSRNRIYIYLAIQTIWFVFISFMRSSNIKFYSIQQTGAALIGGFTIIFTLFLFFQIKKTRPVISQILFISLFWMITFSLFPWIIAPYSIFETGLRYSVQQGAGLAVWMALIFFIAMEGIKEKNLKSGFGILVFLIVAFTSTHILLTRNYLSTVYANRNVYLDQKLWNKIFHDYPNLPQDGPTAFFLAADNPLTAEWDLRFGFSSRTALHYQITRQNSNPFMLYEYDRLLSMISDKNGKAIKAQGYEPIPLPLDHVFGYILKEGELYNVTDELRQKLSSDLKASNTTGQKPQP